jgi:SAM-dependent methyltransferase
VTDATRSKVADEYEYGGLMAEAWDLLRGDTSDWPDRAYYLEVIRRFGEPVLDVGCGTGRLLLDYLGQGIDIDGVDDSPEMLALLKRKADAAGLAPTAHLQKMESLDLPRHYRTILVPSSSFQLVLDRDAARTAMRRFRDHLLPGGALAMSFIWMDRPGQPLEETWQVEKVRPEDGALVRRTAWARYDPASQLEDTDDLYEVIRDGVVVASERRHRSPATRFYSRDEARALYEEAGLRIEETSPVRNENDLESNAYSWIVGVAP